MEKEQSVWKQINEDQEDYQYFKERDQEELKKTMESLKERMAIDKKD